MSKDMKSEIIRGFGRMKAFAAGDRLEPVDRRKWVFAVMIVYIFSMTVVLPQMVIRNADPMEPGPYRDIGRDISKVLMIALVGLFGLVTIPFWRRYRKYDSVSSLYLAIPISLLVIGLWVLFLDDPVGGTSPVTDFIFWTSLSLSMVFLGFHFWMLREGPNFVIPNLIIIAEQESDEYQDGYSPRPTTFDFPKASKQHLMRFGMFLAKHDVFWEIVENYDSVRMYFFWDFFKELLNRPSIEHRSYIELSTAGEAEIFIQPNLYEFLKRPVSYHLLCEHVIERIILAFELFQKRKKRSALKVFLIEKAVRKKELTNIQSEMGEEKRPNGTEGGPGGVGD